MPNNLMMKIRSSFLLRDQPSILRKQLKDYQLVGLNWLYLLYKDKLNGILADEMGLGKTIQTISLFAQLKGDVKHPHLLVVPPSTLENWRREFEIWCPDLIVVSYYGSHKERDDLKEIIDVFDVLSKV